MSNKNKALSPRIVNHIVQQVGIKAGIGNSNPRLQRLNPPTPTSSATLISPKLLEYPA